MKRIIAGLAVALASIGIAFAQAPAKDTKKPAVAKEAAAPAKAPAADAKKADLMDINSASEKELATLTGIGDVRAKAIIKGRPYKGKDDLVQKKILTKKVYDGIKDQIIAKQK
ncbi:MAG TPA: helix-hairpin-helix domain-containing protein [Usitatibacter sp.]